MTGHEAMTEWCPSLNQKLRAAFYLSLQLCYDENKNPRENFRPHARGREADMIWGHVDGLEMKYADKMLSGHCSLNAMVRFDVEKYEARIDRDILVMLRVLEAYGMNPDTEWLFDEDEWQHEDDRIVPDKA